MSWTVIYFFSPPELLTGVIFFALFFPSIDGGRGATALFLHTATSECAVRGGGRRGMRGGETESFVLFSPPPARAPQITSPSLDKSRRWLLSPPPPPTTRTQTPTHVRACQKSAKFSTILESKERELTRPHFSTPPRYFFSIPKLTLTPPRTHARRSHRVASHPLSLLPRPSSRLVVGADHWMKTPRLVGCLQRMLFPARNACGWWNPRSSTT